MIRIAFQCLLLTFILGVTSCSDKCTKGDGPRIEYTVFTAPFESLNLTIPATITLYPDTIFRVIARSQENIAELIEWNIESRQLSIDINECLAEHEDIELDIYSPALSLIKLRGIGDIRSGFLIEQERLNIDMDGSGDIELVVNIDEINALILGPGNLKFSGEVEVIKAKLEASGDLRAFDLVADTCFIESLQSGHSEVRVNEYLNVVLNGSGDVRYKGFPAIDTELNSSGKVIDAN